jgi:hypothetical protein
MTSLRERVLYEWLKDQFYAIHKSQEINKEMGIWERNIMNINETEIDRVCKKIAKDTDNFVTQEKAKGKEPTNVQIMNKMKEVLRNL